MEIGELARDHLSVAVKDLKDQGALGLAVAHRGRVQSDCVNIAFVPFDGERFERLELNAMDSPVGRLSDKRGTGSHEVAFKVKDIENMLERRKVHDMELIDHQPRSGAKRPQVACVQPSATGRILFELVQQPGGQI